MSDESKKSRVGLPSLAGAAFLDVMSAAAQRTHNKSNFVGKAEHPGYLALRYRRLKRPYDPMDGQWLHYEGIKKSGFTPSKYGAAAIILADREVVENARALSPGAHEVYSYRLGSAVMFGLSHHNPKLLTLENPQDEDYKIAVRVGRGPLDAQLGEWTFSRSGNVYVPFREGVRKGPIVSLDEVPAPIRVV